MQAPSYLSIASPDVLAAWHQVAGELEAEAPPQRRPAQRARPQGRNSARSGAALLLVPLLALLGGVAATAVAPPLLAARQLQRALAAEDTPALAALADWDQLRGNLARRMLPPGPAPAYLNEVAGLVADGLANAEALRDTLRGPAGVPAALPRPGPGGVWRLDLTSTQHGRVEVTLARAAGAPGRWLVVDLALPASTEASDE